VGDNGHVAANSRGLTTAGPTGALAARVRSAARQPVLWGTSTSGDVALAAVVTIVAVAIAAKGYLYVPHVPGIPRNLVYPHMPRPPRLQPRIQSLRLRSLALIGVVAATAPLAFRRTYPSSAFLVMLVAFIATKDYSTGITVAAVIFAGYCTIAYSKYRRTALLGLLAGAAVITIIYPDASAQVPERYTPLLVVLPTVALGYMMRMWKQRAGESAERLRLAEAAHEAETRRAVETERARIASEMHDVVTHNVSVMVVQAGAARRMLDSLPDDTSEAPLVRQALLSVEASGRTAMTELRHLLGLLAPPGDGPVDSFGQGSFGQGSFGQGSFGQGSFGQGSGSADAAVLEPQPGLAQVPSLVERVRTAGLPVELSITGKRDLPPGLDLAAYRVVQEALTNVIKHAGQVRTLVSIEHQPRDLRITVSDEGRRAGSVPAAPVSGPSPGHGLIGMRERIAVYRGELDTGPRPGGGWRVAVKVPLDQAASS
jgi:signal transduction histidine kinase